jgi:hypothetical protein
MVGKFLFATTALGVLVALGSGTACSVKTTSGSGGATTAGVTSTGTSMQTTSTGSMCVPNTGTKKCSACAAGGCGVPDQNTDLAGNCGTGTSWTKYADYFDCLCGADGASGKCGSQCAKTCTGSGTDGGMCMSCLQGAVTGSCSAQYSACAADK